MAVSGWQSALHPGRPVPQRRIVSICVALACSAVVGHAIAEPRGGGLRPLPEATRPEVPRRIPGEGVQEEPPAIEDEGEDRRAAPPDTGGCPYRGRKLELIV